MTLKAVLIKKTGDVVTITYKNPRDLKTKFKTKGRGGIKKLHNFGDMILMGYNDGLEKNINRFELPPPIDNNLYYGDIIIYKNKKSLTKEDFNKFYNAYFQFEDLDDNLLDDELEYLGNDDYDYSDGFVVRDEDCDEDFIVSD